MPTRADVVTNSGGFGNTSGARTATLTGCGIGDLLVIRSCNEDGLGDVTIGPTTTAGTTSAWTSRVNVGLQNFSSRCRIWTATVSAAGTVTVSATLNIVQFWGYVMSRYAASDWTAIGDTGSKYAAGGVDDEFDNSTGVNQTVDALVTTVAGSAIEFIAGDWTAISTNPTAGERREADAGTMTVYETLFQGNSLNYGCHGGYYANAGATGAKIVGFSPIRRTTVVGIEITPGTAPPPEAVGNRLRRFL